MFPFFPLHNFGSFLILMMSKSAMFGEIDEKLAIHFLSKVPKIEIGYVTDPSLLNQRQ